MICGFGAFLKRITLWIQLALAGKKRSGWPYRQSGVTESFPKAGGYFSVLSIGLEMLSGGKNNLSPTGLKILLSCPRILRLPFAQSPAEPLEQEQGKHLVEPSSRECHGSARQPAGCS